MRCLNKAILVNHLIARREEEALKANQSFVDKWPLMEQIHAAQFGAFQEIINFIEKTEKSECAV